MALTRELDTPAAAGGSEGDPLGVYGDPGARPSMSLIGQPGSMAVGNTDWGIQRPPGLGGPAGNLGLDLSDETTFTRPVAHTRGMFGRLHDEAAARRG